MPIALAYKYAYLLIFAQCASRVTPKPPQQMPVTSSNEFHHAARPYQVLRSQTTLLTEPPTPLKVAQHDHAKADYTKSGTRKISELSLLQFWHFSSSKHSANLLFLSQVQQ